MASPPPYGATSPPAATPLALPRQRPSLALPTGFKSRTTSTVSTPSGLRQTSYPPEDSLEAQHRRVNQDQYSPVDDDSIGDLSDDGEIKSAISGPGDDEGSSRKRKRGEKRSRGRPPKQYSGVFRQSSVSLVNGEDGKSAVGSRRGGTAGAGSAANGEGDDDEDEDDDAAARDAKDGFNIDKEELERERERRFLFREAVNAQHQSRYDSFNRVKLKQADVRRLVNATLSQSVPQNVVTVVMAYTKMFAGMLIESAREVQDEWMLAEEKRPDGEDNRAYRRLRMMQPAEEYPEEEELEEPTSAEKDGQASDEVMGGTEEKGNEKPEKGGDEQPDGGDKGDKGDKESKSNGEVQNNAEATSKEPSIKQEKDDTEALTISDIPPESSNGTIIKKENQRDDAGNQPGDTQPNSSPSGTQNSARRSKDEKNKEDGDLTSAVNIQPGAGNLAKYIEEVDRGPLLPDHFREALRRYRRGRIGGTVGFTGLSLEGRENAAVLTGGRKLFR